MRRVPPSMLVREELERLLAGGVDEGENIISTLVDTVTQAGPPTALGGRAGRLPRRPRSIPATRRRSARLAQRL